MFKAIRDTMSRRNDLKHDLIISGLLIIVILNTISVNANVNHCNDRKFMISQKTTHMQFTKETVGEEYAVEGQFKSLHCCAKGYQSIEWFKDGRAYPWSSEQISSLILYPQAANQTIYARHAMKTDEGRYSCILRNDTYMMEHHIDLKIKSSSPDVPLPTFRPQDQYADIGGSARFYCEAFIGKKDLPDIAISTIWFQKSEENNDDELLIDGGIQEVVKREDEQIVGSYLTIQKVESQHYGRYFCRIEMGNSQTHRLEMSASLINALPIEALNNDLFLNPYFLATCATILVIILFFLVHCIRQWCTKHLITFSATEMKVLNYKNKDIDAFNQSKAQKTNKLSTIFHNKPDDIKIMINGT